MFELRPARKEDAAAIRRLIHLVGINPTGLDWQRFVLAVDPHDRMAGCAQVKPHGDGTRELASLAVQSAYRGQGVARRLIEYLLAHHPPPLYLTCRSRLQPFYEKFGFQVVSPQALPPYFRRIARLAAFFGRGLASPDGLRVMRRGESEN
jgi:N-acetylglutamate synthase-like GNAT family acetyltransferase